MSTGPDLEKMTDEELSELQDAWQVKEDEARGMIIDIVLEFDRRREGEE